MSYLRALLAALILLSLFCCAIVGADALLDAWR